MKHLNLLAFIIFILLVGWVFMFSTEAKRKIQRPILSLFGIVNKAAHVLTVDEDVVNGVNIGAEALAKKYNEEELAERYSLLLREVMELRAIKSQFAQIQRDNLKLRQSLGFSQDYHLDLIPARVMKRESSTWWNELWINKGEGSGFALDSPVLTTTLAQEGADVSPALVGKVTALAGGTAKVLLLTDERCKVAAKVERTLESGLLMGSRTQGGAPVLKLRYLSKNTDKVTPGQRVVSSNSGGVVPPNILLGTVTKFEKLEFYGEATVEPAVDFAQLTDVFVIEQETAAEVVAAAEAADAAAAAAAARRANGSVPTAEPVAEQPRAKPVEEPRAKPVEEPRAKPVEGGAEPAEPEVQRAIPVQRDDGNPAVEPELEPEPESEPEL